MLTNERCYEIDDYIHQLIYHNGENVTEEMKPKNREEQEYFEKVYRVKLKRKQEKEDHQRRYEAAQKEALELLEKYTSKDYKPFGKFNNPIFKQKEKKIDKLVQKEIENHPEVQEDGVIDMFYLETKKKLFKEMYNIDWFPQEATLSEKFIDEYYKILDKYNLKCDVISW